MTSDFVPVIYHDFRVSELAKKQTGSPEGPTVYSLTLAQFLNAASHQPAAAAADRNPLIIPQPFCTLQEILEDIQGDVGLNVEFKYPSPEELNNSLNLGAGEEGEYPDMNAYIDHILSLLFEHSRNTPSTGNPLRDPTGNTASGTENRSLLLTSFHADVCVALKCKQNVFPVGLLTATNQFDGTDSLLIRDSLLTKDSLLIKDSPLIRDCRCKTISAAVSFAKNFQFSAILFEGCTLLQELILKRPSYWTTKVKKEFECVLTYGLENSDKTVAEKQIEAGLNGLITDYLEAVKDLFGKNKENKEKREKREKDDTVDGDF